MKRIILVILILFLLTGCNRDSTLTKTNLALDTVVTVTLYDGTSENLDEAFNIINKYDNELDSYSDSSTLSKIGQEPTELEPEIYDLINENVRFYQLTGGLFNPTLGSLIKLWNINEPEVKEPPSQESINQALEHIDTTNLTLDEKNKTVSIADTEEQLNLGASAKGFIAEQLKTYLENAGVHNALINLGGNVLLIGDKNGENYNIGIDNPDGGEEEVLGTISLGNKSIVTSGNYQRYFTDNEGNVYHHILDPTTGYPANNDLKEVVVITENSLEADILSTSLFLMGKDKAIEFVNKNFSNIDIILVTKDDNIYISKTLENQFKLNPNLKDKYTLRFI